MANRNLNRAKENKRDEFYTLLSDIEEELSHYTDFFKNKVVYLNCDNPSFSNFWTYFYTNFNELRLKELIATYISDNGSFKYSYEGRDIRKTKLKGDGDFRSPECIDILKDADIVVTNPPFSLFRDFVSLMTKYNKDFLVIGNINAISYKEIFPLIKENKVSLGYNHGNMSFYIPEKEEYKLSKSFYIEDGKYYRKFGNICWFTTLEVDSGSRNLVLDKIYKPEDYPNYDNYNAIEVSRVDNIPKDYYGIMGVPITYLHNHNPDQFEILGIACGWAWSNDRDLLEALGFNPNIHPGGGLGIAVLNGKSKYARVLIRRKNGKIQQNSR